MKIKSKLMLAMMGMSLILILTNGITILRSVYQEIYQEKTSLSSKLTEQNLLSFTLVSDDLEYYFFDACKTEGIANILSLEKSELNKRVQLKLKLKNFITNSTNSVEDAFIVDHDGVFYFSDSVQDDERVHYRQLYSESLAGIENDIYWLMADDGAVYLYRSIYTLAPYIKQGYIVGKLNVEHLLSLVGMDISHGGGACILYRNEVPLLAGKAMIEAYDISLLIGQSNNAQGDWLEYRGSGQRLAFYRDATDRGDWGILYVIPHQRLMETYYDILRISLITYVALVILAALLALNFSRSLTKGIRSLTDSIKTIHDGSMDQRLTVSGHDEIAELAGKFNWLLNHIDRIHRENLDEISRREQARYELLELKYRFIQSQISPHFISNVISSISSFSLMNDSEKMEALCIKTSQYLKNNIHNNDSRFVTVRDELGNVSDYVQIYRLISALPLVYTEECPEALENESILSMMLQPLVENAFLHATNCEDNREFILQSRVSREADWLILRITDNGCGIDEETLRRIEIIKADSIVSGEHLGFGIGGVIRRLRLQYGENYRFEIETSPNVGTCILIGIPLKCDTPLPDEPPKSVKS